jgi:hypothetical protein
MLAGFEQKLERYLNDDGELGRRLEGFKTFSGTPDGHYSRARKEGAAAVARAVRCYPFGGESRLSGALISIRVSDRSDADLHIRLDDGAFSVRRSGGDQACLRLKLPSSLLARTILGRHRWLWTLGMDEVEVGYREDLPHSDWVTLLEVLVAMQELAELDAEVLERVAAL